VWYVRRVRWLSLVVLVACSSAPTAPGAPRSAPAASPPGAAVRAAADEPTEPPGDEAQSDDTDQPAIPRLPAREPSRGVLVPKLDLGETLFKLGSRARHVAACDATRAVSMDDGPRVLVWSLPDGARRGALGEFQNDILRGVACNGELALIYHGETAELFRGTTRVASDTNHDESIAAIALDGDRAITLDFTGKVRSFAAGEPAKVLWNGSPPSLHTTMGANRYAYFSGATLSWVTRSGTKEVTFPTDLTAIADVGDAIVVADANGAVRVLTTPTLVAPSFTVDEGHGTIWSIAGDRTWIAIGTHDGVLVQWKRGSRAPLAPVQIVRPQMYAAVEAIAIAGDAWLVGGDDDRIHRIALGASTESRPAHSGHDGWANAVATDGTWLVSGGLDGAVLIHTLAGRLVRELRPRTGDLGASTIDTIGVTPAMLWALADEHTLYRWRRPDLKPLAPVENVSSVAALDDATLAIVRGRHAGTLDLATGKVSLFAEDLDLTIGAVAARKDTIVVIETAKEHAPVVILDRSGKVLAKLAYVRDRNTTVMAAVADDGQTVAIAEDEELRLWSRATGTVTDLGAHVHNVSALRFAPDGTLATGDWYGITRIWKPGEEAPRHEIRGHLGWVSDLAWSGTDKLVSASYDGHVQLIEVPR
jgi:WD40 repeat protein